MDDAIDQKECPWHELSKELHQHFAGSADSQCLLWVNPAQSDPFNEVPLVRERRVRVPINHPRFDVRLAPYLVPLNLNKPGDKDLFRDSVDMAWQAWNVESLNAFAGQPIAGWVATHAPATELARHWAWRCHLHTRRGLNKLLRFHDPSVREWLWESLTGQQKRLLLGPADSIVSIGRCHTMARHVMPQHDTSGDTSQPLLLDEKQWAQVEDFAAVHAAWLAFSLGSGDHDPLPSGWAQDVFEALSHATTFGIDHMLDRELFALHALQLGSAFHTAERMLPVWEKTRSGNYYGSAVEEVFGRPGDQLHQHPQNA